MTLGLKYLSFLIVEVIKALSIGIIIGTIMCYLIWSFLQAMLREDEIRQQEEAAPAHVQVIDWQAVADEEVKQRGLELDAMSDQERMNAIVLEP